MKIISKKLWFFVPVAAGIIVFALLVKFKSRPSGEKTQEQAAYVQVFRVSKQTVVPKVVGFGTVQPGKIWKAYPQVSGKIVWISERLDVGEFFRKGEKLLQIDDSVYKLRIIQQKAEIKKIEATLLELAAKERSYNAKLKLHKMSLALNLREQKRQRDLAKANVVSASSLEKQQITTLIQENNVQDIQTSLDLLPSQIKYQQAQLEAAKALLAQAQLDLEYTQVEAPFDCRIAKADVEISQYVQLGQEMLEADGIGSAEVVAQVDVGRLATLVLNKNVQPGRLALSAGKFTGIPAHLGLTAVIKHSPNGRTFRWKAKCERMEPVDPSTRTVGVAAVVYNPYRSVSAERPPLVKGMYCEVDIYGREQPDSIVIPRSAVHDGTVYLVTPQKRLEIREIELKYEIANIAVVKTGLETGDVIVTSDLIPAINGMLLDTTVNIALEARIKLAAAGKEEDSK
ncbi:MAG: efflux RND transporter periplasmic adaptor subunit [Victivallaceae bacterium]